MRILHCCLAAFYNEGYGYQENILPKMHKLQGHEVKIIASTETFVDKINLGYVSPTQYVNGDGIPVVRLPYLSYIPNVFARKLRIYDGLKVELYVFNPDVIFLHDAQFLSINTIVDFMRKNKRVKLFVDSHTDFGNSATNFISRHILHGIIYKSCIRKIIPYAETFYGTLPMRVDFLTQFYNVPSEKVRLLVMGADDELINEAREKHMREKLRARFNIADNTLLIVAGGKFDSRKRGIIDLMKAVIDLNLERDVRLLVFGSVMDDLKVRFNDLVDGNIVQYAGWISGKQTYDYFEAADLIVFPGSHSVLWEQAVGQGKPCVFKNYMGQRHIDLGGNCKIMSNCSDIKGILIDCINNYEEMKTCAEMVGVKEFSYYQIAKRAIND